MPQRKCVTRDDECATAVTRMQRWQWFAPSWLSQLPHDVELLLRHRLDGEA